MRKRNFLVTTARTAMAVLTVTAGTMLTACTDNEIYTDGPTAAQKATAPDNAIAFGTYMGKTATRAVTTHDYTNGPISNAADAGNGIKSLAQARFGVFSYLTTSDYDPSNVASTPSNIYPNFMYDQEIQWSTSDPTNMWIYSPVKYWPNGTDSKNPANNPSNTAEQDNTYAKLLSFFAYAPYMAKSTFGTAGTGTAGTDYPMAIGANTNFKTVSSPTNGIVAMTTNEFIGNVWLKYMMPTATESAAVDLLWGVRGSSSYSETDNTASTGTVGNDYNINLTKQTVDERVSFLFKHALAKVGGSTTTSKNLTKPSAKCGFKVKVDVDANDADKLTNYFGEDFDKTQTLVTIKEVKIMDGGTANTYTSATTSSDIYSSGWFNIETGTWDMTGAKNTGTIDITVQNNTGSDNGTNTFTLNPQIREKYVTGVDKPVTNATGVAWNPSASSSTDGYTGGAEGVEPTAKPLFADEYVPGMMFIPGNATQTIYVRVDYIVRTADANLKNGFTEVEQIILNKVELPSTVLKSNKVYDIIMHLGLTSVKFEATVANWQKYSDSSLDENGNETGGSDENKGSVWLPSNVVNFSRSANVTYGETSYAFDGSALGLGDVVSGTLSGSITKVEKDGTTSTTANITLTANNNTATVSSTTTITYELGTVTLTINQAPVAISVSCDNNSISKGSAVTLTVKKSGSEDIISGGSYTVEVFTDAECNTSADASAFTDSTSSDGNVTFNTDGTYYIKVTSGESTVVTTAITVS